MFRVRPGIWSRKRPGWKSLLSGIDRKRKIFDLFFLLIFLMIINVFLISLVEDLSVWEAIWLTMSTITTVGYGDVSAQTVFGQLITIVLMYLFGIFLLAQIAGEWIDFRFDRRERMRKGMWRWKMSSHIVVINVPDQNGDRYLKILVEQIRRTADFEYLPILVVSDSFPDGLPQEVTEKGVVLHCRSPETPGKFSEVDIEKASYILVITTDINDPRSDSVTLDILDQLKAYDLQGHVIAECIQDDNRKRLQAHGADAVIRPVRAYPELMVRTMAAPGSEVILENLFTHEGDHPHRYDVEIGEEAWGKLSARFIIEGLGTPLGFMDHEGVVITNPRPEVQVAGKALFLMVQHDKTPSSQDVLHCLADH